MRILVTGANGYIGRHVVKELLDRGVEVIATDITLDGIDSRAFTIESNIFDLSGNTYEYFKHPDACIHMAWRNGFIHNSESHISDLSSHFTFLTSLIKSGLSQLAVMGTMHEVGYWEGAITNETPCNPTSLYGISKDALRRSLSLFCYENKCTLQWLRCFYILGDDKKNNSIFAKLLRAEENGCKTFPFTSGKNKYDFIEIDKLAIQIASVVSQDEIYGIINCCTGKPTTLRERVEQFIQDNNLCIKLNYGEYPDRPYDSPCIYGDYSKIQQILDNEKDKL